MAIVTTFIHTIEEGERREQLLDGLEVRLTGRAQVGRKLDPPEAIPVIFHLHDEPERVAVGKALDAVDRQADLEAGDWRRHLSVEGS